MARQRRPSWSAGWLDLAAGSLRWEQLVDTNTDGINDTMFGQVLITAEQVRLDPSSTRAQLLAQEDILQRVLGR